MPGNSGMNSSSSDISRLVTVWIREILAHEYGVDIESCHWFEGGLEVRLSDDEREARFLRSGERRPDITGAGQCLDTMMANSELGAVVGARKPSCIDQSTGVRRLFENYRHVEREYCHKTGIFPIMHTLVIRQEIVDGNPWPYGIAPNRDLLNTCVTDLQEQGLLAERIDPCAHRARVVGNPQ